MTLYEIKELKKEIDQNINYLEKKNLKAKIVSDTMQNVIKHNADDIVVKIYLESMGELVDEIKLALQNMKK